MVLKLISKYWQFFLIVLMGIYIVYLNDKTVPTSKNDDRIDSILQVLTTDKINGNFVQEAPKPTIIVVPQQNSTSPGLSNEMLKAFQELKDENAKTLAYAKAIALKVYHNKYQDSTVAITVQDSVEGGVLTNQKVDWTVKPRKIKYYENIYYMKPKYTVSAGLQFQTRIDTAGFTKQQLFPKLGFKNRKGLKFEAGINILNTKEFMFGIEKDIFTKYNKIEKKKEF